MELRNKKVKKEKTKKNKMVMLRSHGSSPGSLWSQSWNDAKQLYCHHTFCTLLSHSVYENKLLKTLSMETCLIEWDERLEKVHVAENTKRRPPVVIDLLAGAGVRDTVWFNALHYTDCLQHQTNTSRWCLHRPHYCDVLATGIIKGK